MRTRTTSQNHIYTGRGTTFHAEGHVHDDPEPVPREHTSADRVPITEIMTRDVICGRPDLQVEAIVELLTDNHIGCLPIVDERGRPLGMVTRFDLVEDMQRSLRERGSHVPWRTARELMMPLALTLRLHATVAHASAMMAAEDVHHVMIVDGDGCLVGVVSTKDIVYWLVLTDAK